MERIVIFTSSILGHNMEYLHHIYGVAVRRTNNRYIFVVPKSFEQVKHNLSWETADHITFDYITDEESAALTSKGKLATSYHLCKIARQRVKRYHANKLFVMTLMSHLPFAPFMYGRKVQVSGIIYKIYLYNWKSSSWLHRAVDILKYALMRSFTCFSHVYILNDQVAARLLNRIYRTTIFRYLPDPYIELPQAIERQQVRQELQIAKDQLLLLHFGAMSKRKGTMQIVESWAHLSEEQRARYVFLFAGCVQPDIRELLYANIDAQKGRVRVILKDTFCSYERLASLCTASDLLLIPYLETAQSSGVIGYASQFGVPVLAPNTGLIGKLVRRYRLGYTTAIRPHELSKAYEKSADNSHVDTSSYCSTHRISDFQLGLNDIL